MDDMRVLLDAKDYTQNMNVLGYILLALLFLFFMSMDFLIFLDAYTHGGSATSLFETILVTMLVFLFISFVFKMRGVIFKVPMKIFDNGLGFQASGLSFKHVFLTFGDIKSINFRFKPAMRFAKVSVIIHSVSSEYYFQEHFYGKDSLEKFIENASPILIGQGFKTIFSRISNTTSEYVFER